jgi:hypothetical protein
MLSIMAGTTVHRRHAVNDTMPMIDINLRVRVSCVRCPDARMALNALPLCFAVPA